ncbi:TonB-dependent receptor plug domain-containing protein [Cupriavidus basilensis]
MSRRSRLSSRAPPTRSGPRPIDRRAGAAPRGRKGAINGPGQEDGRQQRAVREAGNRFPDWLPTICAAWQPPCSRPRRARHAEETLPDVVVSVSRAEQKRFDAPAAIDNVPVDSLATPSPLINLSGTADARARRGRARAPELLTRTCSSRCAATAAPRSACAGVRLYVDGIPATMPDGQGQASTADLTNASRIEVLRGPSPSSTAMHPGASCRYSRPIRPRRRWRGWGAASAPTGNG